MKNPFLKEVLLSDINSLVGSALLFSVGLGAALVIWQTAVGQNPITTVFAAAIVQNAELSE